MIQTKQVAGLDKLIQSSLISAVKSGNTVTITRGDNNTVSFTVGNGAKGSTGDKGATGDKGPEGYGGYELAQQNGYTGTREQWVASLKGDTGAKGATGDKGPTGSEGITPTFETTITVSSAGVGGMPTITRNTVNATTKTYSLTMKIPQGKAGSAGSAGTSYTLSTTPKVTKSTTNAASAAACSITWSGTVGTVNITLPTGNTGATGTATKGATGTTPTLNSATLISGGSAGATSYACTSSNLSGAATYAIKVGRALKGRNGYQGNCADNCTIFNYHTWPTVRDKLESFQSVSDSYQHLCMGWFSAGGYTFSCFFWNGKIQWNSNKYYAGMAYFAEGFLNSKQNSQGTLYSDLVSVQATHFRDNEGNVKYNKEIGNITEDEFVSWLAGCGVTARAL